MHADPRADLLDWLAVLFLQPPTALDVGRWRGRAMTGALAALGREPTVRRAVEIVVAALSGPPTDERLAAVLAHDFALLFEGVGGPRGVPPYESVHQAPPTRLAGPATDSMLALLRRHGVTPVRRTSELPEHLSVELALLAHLTRSGTDGRELAARMAAWLPTFAARCASVDRHGFFAGCAALAAELSADLAQSPERPSASDQPQGHRHDQACC
jgi:TorA-specific chaperone